MGQRYKTGRWAGDNLERLHLIKSSRGRRWATGAADNCLPWQSLPRQQLSTRSGKTAIRCGLEKCQSGYGCSSVMLYCQPWHWSIHTDTEAWHWSIHSLGHWETLIQDRLKWLEKCWVGQLWMIQCHAPVSVLTLEHDTGASILTLEHPYWHCNMTLKHPYWHRNMTLKHSYWLKYT